MAQLGSRGGRSAPPAVRLRRPPDHLLTLVDDVGIIQHADGVVPDRASGYCVDDVARLVIVALGLDREDDRTFGRILARGLSFLRHAWDPDAAGMHNFMAYDRHWLDDPHDGDHVGRAAWALAEVAAPPPRTVPASLRLLRDGPGAGTADSRAPAFAVIGLSRPIWRADAAAAGHAAARWLTGSPDATRAAPTTTGAGSRTSSPMTTPGCRRH